MKHRNTTQKNGSVLILVVTILVSLTLLITGLLKLSTINMRETEQQIREAQAFWLAEAGVQQCIADLHKPNGRGDIPETILNLPCGRAGSYVTDESDLTADPPYIVIAGTVTAGGQTTTRRIRIELAFADPSYNEVISGINKAGTPWTFLLGGTGNPVRSFGFPAIPGPGDTERGGYDEAHGDVYTGKDGDIYMCGDSHIYPAPFPNNYGFTGDANTAGGNITTIDAATIDGIKNKTAPARDGPDLVAMNYSNTATHNLTDIFKDAGISNGRLPKSSYPDLYNLVRKDGDDYYFETTGSKTRETLEVGNNRVYYIDGNLFFNKSGPLQFDIDGTATIVATGDIHIGDGLRYLDNDPGGDLLALIALGEYDLEGKLIDGGDIYFGDALFGTVYEMDAFMFAAHDFKYNVYASNNKLSEPDTGFKVFGNFVALNQLVIYRDWYGTFNNANPALFDVTAGVWKDAISGVPLTLEQIEGGEMLLPGEDEITITIPPMRHYRLVATYDERIHDPATQPPGLPAADSSTLGLFNGILSWQHDDL